jgi:hypothetical protein
VFYTKFLCISLNVVCFTWRLHRQPKHLLDFLLAELGTSGSVDGNNQLIIKGRFQQKQIENVLRRYIKEYVTCHTCRSPDTILQKDTRLFFLQCETCGSRCSVASIKSGFQVTHYIWLLWGNPKPNQCLYYWRYDHNSWVVWTERVACIGRVEMCTWFSRGMEFERLYIVCRVLLKKSLVFGWGCVMESYDCACCWVVGFCECSNEPFVLIGGKLNE